MKTQKGNWDDKRPGMGEKLSSRFSIHSSTGDTLGGIPECTNEDFSAAVGTLSNNLQKLVLGSKHGNWGLDRYQLREVITRRSWDLWRENHNETNINVVLNVRIANLVISTFYLTKNQRFHLGSTARARSLHVDPRRYNAELKSHCTQLVGWLDAVESEALKLVRKQLRR